MGDASNTAGYSIIIVGAGIGGLAAAAFLAGKGHDVRILESKPGLNEFGASIGINPSVSRILTKWGMKEAFAPVVVKDEGLEVRDGSTCEKIGSIPLNDKDSGIIRYGSEHWIIHRVDYQQVLAQAAQKSGAKIIFSADVVSVDVETATVKLSDGRKLTADVIVGADGQRSPVRTSIPALKDTPSIPLEEQCWRCTVPKELMRNNPKLKWLLQSPNEFCFTSPGKYVLAWRMPEKRDFDVVACVVRQSDVPPGHWGIKADPVEMAKDFQDFCPEVVELLSKVDRCIKWTLAELAPLPTCRSENGRVMLLGDAWHAMIPHAAGGGNSAIEDAAVLAECLAYTFAQHLPASAGTAAYEALRKPRVERMQAASKEGYGFLSAGGEARERRNSMLKKMAASQEAEMARDVEERKREAVELRKTGDMYAPFPTLPYMLWSYGSDVMEDARRYCRENVR